MVKQKKVEKNKKVLTLFLMMMPSLLLAMTSAIPTSTAIFSIRLGFQAVILLLQFVLVKNLLDEYYSYLGYEE